MTEEGVINLFTVVRVLLVGGILFIIGFGFSLLLGAVFCTVGGLIGEKVIINIKTFADGHAPPDRVIESMY